MIRSLISTSIVVTTFFLLVYSSYKVTVKKRKSIPVIECLNCSIRIKPEIQDGLVLDNTDKKVYNFLQKNTVTIEQMPVKEQIKRTEKNRNNVFDILKE